MIIMKNEATGVSPFELGKLWSSMENYGDL